MSKAIEKYSRGLKLVHHLYKDRAGLGIPVKSSALL